MHRWTLLLTTVLMALAGLAAYGREKSFGFRGIEFYKLDWNTQNLRIGDVNGDGLNDIIVANNARARIECLVQRAQLPASPALTEAEEDPLSDTRFESRPFLAEKRLFSLELGDLNGDGRTDMAYYGDPRELVVVYQEAGGRWGPRRTFDIADGATHEAGLAIGDLNGDGRNDLALLSADGLYFIYQDPTGTLGAPVKESGLPEGAVALTIRDFNGDGRADLLYLCNNETHPFCLRFQDFGGRLGPEIRCKAPAVRAAAVGDVNGDGADEVIAIQMLVGRMVIYRIAQESASGSLLDGPFERYALRSQASRRPHALAIASFGGRKQFDLVLTDPDAAEVEFFTQAQPGLWHRRAAFPTLQGATDIAILDSNGPGAELIVLSPEEPMLGLARMDERGKLGFPRALTTTGKPTCMCVADLDEDGKPEIVYAATEDRERVVRALVRRQDGFEEMLRIPLADARADPDGLLVADINQDGRKDILVFIPYQEMRVLKAGPDGKFIDVSRGADYGKGLVQGARLKSTGLADVNRDGKPEVLLASKNFARALRMDQRDRLEVVEQFNGRSPTSQIVGVAGADLDGDSTVEILLVDASNRCISLLKPDASGAYRIVENLAIGPVALERLHVADLTGRGRPDILFLGQSDFSVLRPGMPKTVLREVASYETAIPNGRLDSVAVGDLDGDKRPEILVTEGTKNVMSFLAWDEGESRLHSLLSWPVFEAKTFPGSRFAPGQQAVCEPREFDVGDVTGDGKPDVVLLIHDRVLVYPQE